LGGDVELGVADQALVGWCEGEGLPQGGNGRGRLFETFLLAGRGPFLNGDIQVGLAVQVVVIRSQQGGYSRLGLDRTAGRVMLFDMDVPVRHEAEVRPCSDLKREEGEKQEYEPVMGMSEGAWHMVRDG